MVAKIRVRWPDGGICGACFTTAVNTYGTCAQCSTERLLPGRSPSNEIICRDCAGITTTLSCDRCDREGERIRSGLCASCVVTEDLAAILHPNNPPDLRLHRLIREMASTNRPQSIRTWMRGKGASELLRRLGSRDLALNHDAFDREPPSRAVEHLREMLVHHHILPSRGDIRLARFETWLDNRLDSFAGNPHVLQPLEQFGRWHHLRRLRQEPPAPNMDHATRAAKQEITEAGKFLIWLQSQHGAHVDDLRQEHIDLYWSEGSSTRKHIRNFLQQRGLTGHRRGMIAPAREAQTSPSITGRERLDHLRRVVEADKVTLSTRVAAIILLLYGTPIGTIAGLRVDDFVTSLDGMTISLGRQPAPIPDPLIPLFTDYLANRSHNGTMNKNSPWLFPSTNAGQHISATSLLRRFKIFGIQALGARNATLADLTLELDPTSLASLLGYSAKIMTKHAARAGVTMAIYPALHLPADGPQ
ncbi:hypothetical protein ACFQ9V_01630 [Leifsonia sp. NPDC056665]|uniref:hypothetical protein n=1 Tax=Leifsonia sp. NPDC056665 TaxID=3345901 RepID=UPI0036BD5A1A